MEISVINQSAIADAVAQPAIQGGEIDVNFVTRIRKLVNQIITQLSRISEIDRHKSETLKRQSQEASHNIANTIIRIGNLAPWSAGASLAISLLGLRMLSREDVDKRKMVDLLAGQLVPQGRELVSSRYSAKQVELSGARDLYNGEISHQSQKTGSESNAKQEILALLNSTLEAMKKASSAN